MAISNNNYVTFTAEQANSTIGLERISTNQTFEYSTDNATWNTFDTSVTITLSNIGDVVYIRGILTGNNSIANYTHFKMTGKIASSGNCNALWDYNNLNAPLKEYCGIILFGNCKSLTTAPELPSTTLAQNCYNSMFYGCTSLTTAPELPATTLANGCYASMFYGCTSLTTAPELPSTTLANYCYQSMFGYSGLIKAPELPATTLANYCYQSMFQGCTSLTTAPELPSTTLANGCYASMFYDCTSLDYIKCLTTDISATDCTTNWVNNVASEGVFEKNNDMDSWTIGADGIPDNWTIAGSEPLTPEDIANEIMQEVDIFAVPFNDLYETCLSVYLEMGYSVDDFDEIYAVIQSTPGINANIETFVVSNDSNEKVMTVDNNGDFYLKGVGGYEGKNTKVEDSNIKPLQEVIDEKQTTLVAGNNVQINDNTISATDTTYTASDFDIKNLADSEGLRSKWDNKQNALTAGNNIDITNNVITSKGYTYNNGTITTDDSVTVNGSATVTGKITATNAASHNLVYAKNELNLADVTSGNKLYFNYRNSTNPINEYIFCQGKGGSAEQQRSDITCRNIGTSESIRSNFKLFNISSSDANKYSSNISTVGWYKIAEIDGAMGANGTLNIGTAFYNTRPESYIVNFAEGWNDRIYAVNAVIIGNQDSARNNVLIDKIGFIKSASSPYTLSIYIHYNATVENNVYVALETGSGNITGGGTRFYTLTYDSAITDASFTNIYSTKSGVNIKGSSNDFITGGNELNLSDLTSGNICYLNYRGSTNPINEYRFCKGVGNQSTFGDIRCGALYQTSDITKKNVISDLDLDKAYDLIDKCQTIIYTLKDDERNKEQIGVIAQEIQEFFPEVVSADENGYLALDYSRLTVVIMKVLKDVIKRVQRLEEKK